jgi:Flp pilus assembly protein TadG
MSQHHESTTASCARSAIVPFALNVTPRMPGCLFHPLTRFESEAGFTNASPVTGLRKLMGEDGNNLIEYALVFMFFMSMVLGIVDFSRALYTYHFLSNVAREATRYASVRGSTCNDDSSCSAATPDTGPAAPGNRVVQDYVATIVPPGIDSSKVTVQPNWPVQASSPTICNTTINAPGCTVEVQVSYKFTFVVPFIRNTPLPLSSSSEMIIVH